MIDSVMDISNCVCPFVVPPGTVRRLACSVVVEVVVESLQS